MASFRNRKFSNALIILCLVVITIALYWPVSQFDSINYDDDVYIFNNAHLRDGLTWKGIQWAFTADLTHNSPNADYWQPMTFLSRMLDIQLFGLNPGAFHSINLVLHACNTVLLFLIFILMTNALWPSALVAVLFAIHPVQVDAVAWITARKDVLATFFGFLTMLAYLIHTKKPRKLYQFLIPLLFSFSLMSKPMLIMMPFVLLVLDYWPLQRFDQDTFIQLLWEKRWLMLLSAAIGFQILTGFSDISESASYTFLPVEFSVSLIRYAWKIFFPLHLSLINPPLIMANSWINFWAFAAVTGATAVLFFIKNRFAYLLTGWLWFCLFLIPAVALNFENRFDYVPSAGIFLAVVWAAFELSKMLKLSRFICVGFVSAVLIACFWWSVVQVGYWRNSVTLFSHAVSITQNNHKAEYNLGTAFLERGDIEHAEPHLLEALRIYPDYDKANNNMGYIMLQRGKLSEAVRYFKNALRINPGYEDARKNLVNALYKQNVKTKQLALS